ncbi:hypothetical protein D3C78_990870 [compost metagenome]
MQLLVLVAEGEEVQLLRQQAGRADLGAVAAADARHRRRRCRQLIAGRGEQAVAGLDQRHVEGRQADAHQRAAEDQAVQLAAIQPGEVQQLADGSADQRLDVHRPRQGGAGQGGDPRNQRAALQYGIGYGHCGADIHTERADIRWQAAARHFAAGEDLDQLALAAGGVFGRHRTQLERPLAYGLLQGGDGFRLVVLDADQHLFRLQDVHEDFDALQQFHRALAHQHVVGADVGLAFDAIDDQRVDIVLGARGQLGGGGETGAAEPGDAGLADAFEQRRYAFVAEVFAGLQRRPFLAAVAVDDDGLREQARGMGIGLLADGHHGAGSRRMQRRADGAAGRGDHLALEHMLADFHAGDGRAAGMLGQRQDQALRQRRSGNRAGRGLALVGRWVDAAGEVPDLGVHAACS